MGIDVPSRVSFLTISTPAGEYKESKTVEHCPDLTPTRIPVQVGLLKVQNFGTKGPNNKTENF